MDQRWKAIIPKGNSYKVETTLMNGTHFAKGQQAGFK
jgi:hypothetical protein